MATTIDYLEAVNRVLVRLREARVAATDETESSALIAEFVRQANHEVEDAWDWIDLRETIQITTLPGVLDYGLSGAGRSFRVLDVHEDTLDYDLKKAPSYGWMNHKLLQNDAEFQAPEYWDWNGRTAEGDPIANLWPVPDQTYLVNFNLVIKQPLDTDDTRILAPPLAVILRSTQLALEERGEDGGVNADKVGEQAELNLNNAIDYDRNMYEEDSIWQEV